MHQHGLRVLEQSPLIQQRAAERIAESAGGAVLAIRQAGAEKTARAVRAQRAHQVVEADVDQAGTDDQTDHRLDRFTNHVVRSGEGFVDALFRQHELAHAVVVEGDQRV